MSVAALLAELRSRDIQLWPEGDELRCNAPAGVLTPELRNQLRQRKGDIVEFLRSAETLAQQERAIVPLQPGGTRVPVFGVPGHNGDVFCYRFLAQHLGGDQPFFGLQPPGLDGHSEPVTCVETLAGYFAEQIRAFRPGGPYVITGFCAGGTIAFELARQLREQGAAIDFVGLFTSPYPTWYRVLPQLRKRVGEEVERVRSHARALAPLSARERCRYVSERLRQRRERRDAAAAAVPDELSVRRARVQDATVGAIRRYTPLHFAGRVCLFLPNKESRFDTALLRWHTVARQTEEYFGPDGGHGDRMLLEPEVRANAGCFRRCRDKTNTEARA
ncbi:MAG TPA: thioesterase domain-containing protein [Gemmatimonadales bacterium]|nr:thioesterase domain-containing protein [Gemmatimonadales bacterium]